MSTAITLRLDPEVYSRLSELAERTGTNVTYLGKSCIHRALPELENDMKPLEIKLKSSRKPK